MFAQYTPPQQQPLKPIPPSSPAMASGTAEHFLDLLNEGVWIANKDDQALSVNARLCRILGYTAAELLGKSFAVFHDPALSATFSAEKVKITNGQSTHFESVLLSKTGEKIPVLVSASPTPDGGMVAVCVDLRTIKHSENVYKQLVEHMNEALWMGDAQENTIYVNPKFLALLGYTMFEVLGKPSYYFWESASAERVRKENEKRVRGESSQYEGVLVTKNGEKIPVIVSGTPLPGGGTMGIITDLRDLKAREKQIEGLRKYEHYLAHVLNYSADAIATTDLHRRFQSWNKGAEKIFGFSAEEVIGKSANETILQDQQFAVDELSHLDQVMQKQDDIIDHRTTRWHKEGRKIAVSLTQTTLRDEHHQVIGYSIIYRDISLQKKWEEELERRYKNMQNAYMELGKKGRYLDYMVDLLEMTAGHSDLHRIAEYIVSAVIMMTRVDACTIRLLNRTTNQLDLLAASGVSSEWYGKGSVPVAGTLAEKAFETRKAIEIFDLAQETLYTSPKLAQKNNLSSLLLIPLIVHNQPIGTLSLYISKEHTFELFDQSFIVDFAKLAAIALVLPQ